MIGLKKRSVGVSVFFPVCGIHFPAEFLLITIFTALPNDLIAPNVLIRLRLNLRITISYWIFKNIIIENLYRKPWVLVRFDI